MDFQLTDCYSDTSEFITWIETKMMLNSEMCLPKDPKDQAEVDGAVAEPHDHISLLLLTRLNTCP
jgi:hypothetical protein